MSRTALLALALVFVAGALFLAVDALEPDVESPADSGSPAPVVNGRSVQRADGPGTVAPDGSRPAATAPAQLAPLVPRVQADGAAVVAPDAAPPGRTLSGVVVRASDGSPLPAVYISARGDQDGDPIEVMSSEDPPGAFSLEAVPYDVAELVLRSFMGPFPERRQTLSIDPGEDDLSDLRLVFDSGFSLTGRVTDPHGEPVAGATVDVNRHELATTDAKGRFVVRDVVPDPVQRSVEVGARAPWFERTSDDALVPRDVATVPHVELQLTGSGTVEGTVSDIAGRPMPSAQVRLAYVMTTQHGSPAPRGLDARTDHAGHYLIDHVPPGSYVVQASPDEPGLSTMATVSSAGDEMTPDASRQAPTGLVEVWISPVVVVVAETTRLDIHLPRGGTIQGRITDQSGSPLVGAALALERVMRWPAPELQGSSTSTSSEYRIVSRRADDQEAETVLSSVEAETTTDAQGDYLFEHVTLGEKRLTAKDPESWRVTETHALDVVGDAQRIRMDFMLLTGLTLRGRVLDHHGRPIENAGVHLEPVDSTPLTSKRELSTDLDGWFEATGLPTGEQRIYIYKQGFNALFEDVDPADPPPVYQLEPAPIVRGEVTDARHGEPIIRYTVSVLVGGSSWASTSNWEDGRFEVQVNEDDPSTVSVSAPGFIELTFEHVIPSQTLSAPLQFQLSPEP